MVSQVEERYDLAVNGTILIVDDDDDIRETLADLLLESGYKVLTATNGQQALDVLRSHSPICLVLLDLMMPVMDGQEFRAAVSNENHLADIPIVVITAGGQKLASTAAPGVPVLYKPLRMDDVIEVVKGHCLGSPC